MTYLERRYFYLNSQPEKPIPDRESGMRCPTAAKTTMNETVGAGLEFSLKAAWNERYGLYRHKLKLELNP